MLSSAMKQQRYPGTFLKYSWWKPRKITTVEDKRRVANRTFKLVFSSLESKLTDVVFYIAFILKISYMFVV